MVAFLKLYVILVCVFSRAWACVRACVRVCVRVCVPVRGRCGREVERATYRERGGTERAENISFGRYITLMLTDESVYLLGQSNSLKRQIARMFGIDKFKVSVTTRIRTCYVENVIVIRRYDSFYLRYGMLI